MTDGFQLNDLTFNWEQATYGIAIGGPLDLLQEFEPLFAEKLSDWATANNSQVLLPGIISGLNSRDILDINNSSQSKYIVIIPYCTGMNPEEEYLFECIWRGSRIRGWPKFVFCDTSTEMYQLGSLYKEGVNSAWFHLNLFSGGTNKRAFVSLNRPALLLLDIVKLGNNLSGIWERPAGLEYPQTDKSAKFIAEKIETRTDGCGEMGNKNNGGIIDVFKSLLGYKRRLGMRRVF